MRNEDCIYFSDKDIDGLYCCITKGGLYKEDEDMCGICRLYDSYIPANTSHELIEYAIKWQNCPTEEQEDYYTHFNL